MGRRFLSDYLKNLTPKDLCDAFHEKFKVTPDEIMDSIYNHPFPNRSLSTFSYFLKDHLDNKYAFNLVYEELMRFFQRNIIQYDYKSYPVYFMGNLAYTYADILDLVAKDFGLNIEKTEKSPMRDSSNITRSTGKDISLFRFILICRIVSTDSAYFFLVKKRDEFILKNTKYMFSNQKHILYLYEP